MSDLYLNLPEELKELYLHDPILYACTKAAINSGKSYSEFLESVALESLKANKELRKLYLEHMEQCSFVHMVSK